MASTAMTPGELYFIGERDPRTLEDTAYLKIGIVRESDGRTSEWRVKEHQTGNPRELHLITALPTPVVEQIETLMHGAYAPLRLSGEWFFMTHDERKAAIDTATSYIDQARAAEKIFFTANDLKTIVSSGAEIAPDAEITAVHRELVTLRLKMKLLGDLGDHIADLMRAAHENGADLGRYGKVGEQSFTEKFDENTFKSTHPDLWERFTVETETWSQRFRINEPKELKSELAETVADAAAHVAELNDLVSAAHAGDDLAGMHEVYLRLLAEIAPLEWEEKILDTQLRVACGSAESIAGVCAWPRKNVVATKFDKKAFKNDNEELYMAFVTLTATKPRLNVARDRGFVHR